MKQPTALIIGGGKGIGRALSETLTTAGHNVVATTRAIQNPTLPDQRIDLLTLNPLDENMLLEMMNCYDWSRLSIVLYCVGTLEDNVTKPEKSLRDVTSERLLHSFRVNSIGFALLVKSLRSKIKKTHNLKIAALSAKVGSIGDNKLGGWYGYRASKAALNMLVRNTAIEFKRNGYKVWVYSVHPGTTQTDLSSSYLKKTKLKVHSPVESASNILAVLGDLNEDDSGDFYNWDGSKLPF